MIKQLLNSRNKKRSATTLKMCRVASIWLAILLPFATTAQTDESIKTFTGHNHFIRSVAFSPDGKTIASASDDGTIKLWNISTNQCIRTFIDHTNAVNSIVFSHDGKTLASGSSDNTLKLWNLTTGQCIKTFTNINNAIFSIALSPDGNSALSGSGEKTLKLWDILTGQCIKTFTGHTGDVYSVAFSPDGKTVLSGSYDQTVKIWDITTGQCLNTFLGHTSKVECVAYSPDGRTFLSSSIDGTIKLWDIALGQCSKSFNQHGTFIYSAVYSPNEKTVLSGAPGYNIKLWDVATGEFIKTLSGHSDLVLSVAFSPDGKTALSGSCDKTLKLWDISEWVSPIAKIKKYVEASIKTWQIKGEFETTANYTARVNEAARKKKADELTLRCIDSLKTVEATKLKNIQFILNPYDADNQAFLIENSLLGQFALPVPLANAPVVKANWATATLAKPNFYLDKETDGFKLSKFDIVVNGKAYTYDNKIPSTYATNAITYNFAPLELDVPTANTATNNTKIETKATTVGLADVDVNIPENSSTNTKTYVVIIANEKYKYCNNATYALNDGKVFKSYCEKTLGIPTANIHYAENASFGEMLNEKKWLVDVLTKSTQPLKAIFYYAGHGITDETSKNAYLLPIDGNPSSSSGALSVTELYTHFGQTTAQSVVMFIDACFSGANREDDLLADGRGRLKPKAPTTIGNVISFSAVNADETALPYKDKGHGLFTYYLLKKMQETKGDVTLADLEKYVRETVSFESVAKNNKAQTPTLTTSPAVNTTWQNWKLK